MSLSPESSLWASYLPSLDTDLQLQKHDLCAAQEPGWPWLGSHSKRCPMESPDSAPTPTRPQMIQAPLPRTPTCLFVDDSSFCLLRCMTWAAAQSPECKRATCNALLLWLKFSILKKKKVLIHFAQEPRFSFCTGPCKSWANPGLCLPDLVPSAFQASS